MADQLTLYGLVMSDALGRSLLILCEGPTHMLPIHYAKQSSSVQVAGTGWDGMGRDPSAPHEHSLFPRGLAKATATPLSPTTLSSQCCLPPSFFPLFSHSSSSCDSTASARRSCEGFSALHFMRCEEQRQQRQDHDGEENRAVLRPLMRGFL